MRVDLLVSKTRTGSSALIFKRMNVIYRVGIHLYLAASHWVEAPGRGRTHRSRPSLWCPTHVLENIEAVDRIGIESWTYRPWQRAAEPERQIPTLDGSQYAGKGIRSFYWDGDGCVGHGPELSYWTEWEKNRHIFIQSDLVSFGPRRLCRCHNPAMRSQSASSSGEQCRALVGASSVPNLNKEMYRKTGRLWIVVYCIWSYRSQKHPDTIIHDN